MSSTPGVVSDPGRWYSLVRWYFDLYANQVRVRYVPATNEIGVDPPNADPKLVAGELRNLMMYHRLRAAQAETALRRWLELHGDARENT